MYFYVNDAAYWYSIKGQGDPVILLHGFTGSNHTWSALQAANADQFQLITVDMPGHGQTKTSSPRTMEEFCSDLASLMDYLKFDKAHFVGYSMGGRSALSFAMLYPERVTKLVLESASPGLAAEIERENRKNNDYKLAARIENEGLYRFVDFWGELPLFNTQKKLPKTIQEQIRNERLSHTPEGLAQSLRYMGTGSQPSWWDSLQSLTLSVLLVAGELDEKFVRINKAMNKRMLHSKLKIIKNAGHAIHVEQSEIFGKIIRGFLQSTN